MRRSELPPSNIRGRLLAAAFAFLLWGGWALIANWHAGQHHALIAGLLQGSASTLDDHTATQLYGLCILPVPYPFAGARRRRSFPGAATQ